MPFSPGASGSRCSISAGRSPGPSSLCSFTAYALSHNIGASMLSGAVVRYRAYRSRGLQAAEIGVLIAMSSLTFGLGTVMLGGLVLLVHPELPQRFLAVPEWV